MRRLLPWLVQRTSAVYMLLVVVFLAASFVVQPLGSHAQWQAWVARADVGITLVVFFAALLSHTWVGLRDVIRDRVQTPALRRLLLTALSLGLATSAAWLLAVLVRTQH